MANAKKAVSLKKDKVREDVKKLVAQIANVNAEKIKESANIKDDLGIDSLGSVEILASIEKRLDLIIDQAKAFEVVTVKDLIDLVTFYIKEKNTEKFKHR